MGEPLTNWGGNIRYNAQRVHVPASIDELAIIVRQSSRVRAIGTRHSFNAIADTSGDLISMRNFNRITAFDPDGRTVTVEPCVTYGQLGQYLHERGFAVTNLPSLPHVCVGGAVQTGTHGSGTTNLSADVTEMDWIGADGERSGADSDHARFFVIHQGLLGILTSVTLRIRPTFQIQQDIYEHVPLADLLANFDQVTRAAYSVSFFTDWQTDRVNQVWFKREAGQSLPDFDFLRGRLATRKLHPIAAVDPVNCTEQGVPGPWHERLPHFRHDREPSSAGQELQAEYFVHRNHAPAALRAIAEIGPRLRNILIISEIRTIMADQIELSPAYEQDAVGIHFTLQPNLLAVLEALHDVIEPALSPFNPRPHWGKLFTLDREALLKAYGWDGSQFAGSPIRPVLGTILQVAKQVDPHGKFRNDYTDRYLFGTTS